MSHAEGEASIPKVHVRLPKELGGAFRSHYFHSMRRLMMLSYGFGASLVSFGILAGVVSDYPPGLMKLWGGIDLVMLTGLLLVSRPGAARIWQPGVMGMICLTIPFVLPTLARTIDAQYADPQTKLMAYTGVMLGTMLGCFTLHRMLALWMAFHLSLVFGVGLWAGLATFPAPASAVVSRYVGDLLSPLLLLTFMGYVLEQAYRRAFLNHHLLEIERAKSESLLVNTLPASIAARLKESREPIADDFSEVTVLFADVVDFTPYCADRPARDILGFLNDVFSRFDRLVERHGLEKIKTVGDCYMVIAGAPQPRDDHLGAVARFALDLREETGRISREKEIPVSVRIGIQTGPLAAGVIGEKRFLYDVWGDTVNTASRLESHGVGDRIQVSGEVADRLKDAFHLTYRGRIEIKGKGDMETYFLEGEKPSLHVPPVETVASVP